MNNIKIKLWGVFWVKKKQFIIIYSIFSLVFIALAFIFLFIEFEVPNNASIVEKFFAKYFSAFWFLMFLLLVIEAQFYWYKFIKEQLSIIEKQKNEIADKNEELQQQKEEILAQNDEIEQQKEFAEKQRDEISEKNKHITDSIRYAERIQKAVLPNTENLKIENFILFKPRDIVSGDFYWFKQVENKLLIAAADCTGHGVPGGFISMLGISKLNEISANIKINTAAEVLEILRKEIKQALQQTGKDNEAKDGMDIALSIIDLQNMKLQFAGANNPLYVVRDKELTVIKPTRNPIGIYLKEKPFANNEYLLQENDLLYMFSDGYIDQFGGEKGMKLKSKNFKNLILSVSEKPISEQKQILDSEFLEWRGKHEQIDDVLVMGVKINNIM